MKVIFVALLLILINSSFTMSIEGVSMIKDTQEETYKPGDIEIITSERAPKPIGSYSAGTKLHLQGFSIIQTAGQIGLDPESGELIEDFDGQVNQAMMNLQALIEDNGGSLKKVTRTELFLSDMANFSKVDKIYSEYFTDHFPARAAVAVKDLPKYCYFEIMAEAVVQE